MAQVIFPTTAAIANTVPEFGNSVPIAGTQAITNHSELLAYAALAYENANKGEKVNFGDITGTVPLAQTFITQTDKGDKLLEVRAFIHLKADASMFPDGLKFHKQVTERLPNSPASSSFNY